ncbi:MAG: ABC transporter ATP-binding protein [Thiobacillus sp.]
MNAAPARLTAHALQLRTANRCLVDALDLSLIPGELLGVLGANGAGKSTLLSVLAGLATPTQGAVMFDQQPLAALQPLTRAQHISLLPQGDEGGFLGSVRDFVALGRFPFGNAAPDCTQALADWELSRFADRTLDTLSGGERQRARLAQLAVQTACVILLDEPLTHLDPAHQARLLTWARSQADAGHAVALTLHDPNWAASHCDRLLFLHGDGRWQLGPPAELLTPVALESLYGTASATLWRQTRPNPPG